MDSLIPLLVQLLSGAVGGNVAGAILKSVSLGTLGNSLAGVLGGGVGGQLVGALLGEAAEGLIGQVLGGAVGGALVLILAGFLRRMMGGQKA